MGIENRPYVGTWQLNSQRVVQHTPDCLVYFNGDTSVPGCPRCSGRIDIQQFITGVSVEAGVDPGGHSCSISLSLPRHHRDSLVRDAQFILKPGLEVHVYMKGYFPVSGMYQKILQDKTIMKDGKLVQQSTAKDLGLDGVGLEDIINYPYYPVFHGVVTQVSHSYSGGYNTASINCASMLHFWQYHNMSTNASVFGARPTNSKLKLSLVGHNFTKMTPYEIIYTLFHDTAGSAGGVGFALASKTNQGAQSSVVGKNLFTLTIEYWKKRFDSKMMNLRMHGVSGVLFSAAQAAFLGRLSTSQATQTLRGRFQAKDQVSKKMSFLSAAQTLGFYSPRLKDAITYTSKTRPTTKSAELNITQMQAFALDIGQMGQVNLWESSYQSKIDLVKQITELTGFEFFQDVDGDFVFKPPMYNLDTSSSRTYRIEDIDIISLNHTEKEPEITYMTVKGSHFKNIRGMGLDNEWGVRGQYIDYRLVAKFGWRPGSFDTTYFNNPKDMFFAAINRMDIMNAGINSASVTIPIRPEMRPGFPVYIVSLDCFYYLQSMSHGFQFGNQCTTSLQLTAKRAKFYAPGDPNKTGIASIDLKNMLLPQRPLIGLEEGTNLPRLLGFPNVVMSLDPNQVNPLYLAAGADANNIDDPQQLRALIIAGTGNLGVLEESVDEQGNPIYRIRGSKEGEVFFLDTTPTQRKRKSGTQVIDLLSAAKLYKRKNTELVKKAQTGRLDLARTNRAISRKTNQLRKLRKAQKKNPQAIAAAQKELNALEARKGKIPGHYSDQINQLEKSIADDPSIKFLKRLMEAVGQKFFANSGDFQNQNSSANLLDLLADKKASFSNGSLPGAYRYYSASHPDPDQQGMPELLIQDIDKESTGQKKNVVQNTSKPQGVTRVLGGGFEKVAVKSKFLDSNLPEVQKNKNHKATRGIKILTNDPKEPKKVTTTDLIRTLAFAVHTVKKTFFVTDYKFTGSFTSLPPKLQASVASYFKSVPTSGTFQNMYKSRWDAVSHWVVGGKQIISGQAGPVFPASVKVRNNTILMSANITSVVGTGKPFNNTAQANDAVSKALATYWGGLANTLLRSSYVPVAAKVKLAKDAKATKKVQREAGEAARDFDTKILGPIISVIASGTKSGKVQNSKTVDKNVRAVVREVEIYNPVFPVSDKGGYEVVGTYRYGRDIDIEPGGVMDQLYKNDPTQLADRTSIENYVNALQGKTVTLNGVPVTGTQAVTAAEKIMIDSIKKNPNALDVLQQLSTNSGKSIADAGQLDTALRNWVATTREGVQKLPINNAAFLLSDLQNIVRKKVCSCRSVEADLLLSAFSQDRFMLVNKALGNVQNTKFSENSSSGTLDHATKWLANQVASKSQSWEQGQLALRGAIGDVRDKNLAEAEANPNASHTTQNASTTVSAAEQSAIAAERREAVANNPPKLGTGNNNNG